MLFVLFLVAVKVYAQIPLRLPSVISNHAVLQQSADVKLWGWGPGSFKLAITCSWNLADTVFVNIGSDCMWEASVKTPKSGGPYTIQFLCGKQRIEVTDILIGEVWLCSGQSNMEFNFNWGVSDAGDALKTSDNNSIRLFQITQSYDKYPQSDCKGEWKICNPGSVAGFSAIGYFFGRNINEKLKVPVGMIGSYWGGTDIQAWMPKEAFDKDTSLQRMTNDIEPYGWAAKGSTLLYNSMINPIVQYRLAGVIWYQGEANVTKESTTYGKLFSAMIKSWRKVFSKELPFYYVQIAPWNGYAGIKAALLREQQDEVLSVSRTGMISVGDLIDDVANIHPKAKRETGDRLANMALKEQYGFQNLQPYSPRIKDYSFHKNTTIVKVSSIGKLSARGKEIKNFQIAGPDKVYYPAHAVIEQSGDIKLTTKQVLQPVAIRYCFSNDQIPGLFDVNGLPLLPFRTDSVVSGTQALAQTPVLKFNNGKFKIVQFTDLHWIADAEHALVNDSTIQLMKYVIKTEKPDLVVFTGDVVVSSGAAKAWKEITQPLTELKVPFAVTFGNHDTETDITKQKALEIIQTNPFNVTTNAGKTIDGVGNCALPIKSTEGENDKWVLYMFDSQAYAHLPDTLIKGYDWIRNSQIQWYRNQSATYTKANKNNALPSLAFFHIPTPEFEYVRNLKTTVGNITEPVCAPYFNSGLFTAFVEMRDIMGIFVGHDHNDDFTGTVANICLGYGRKTGYNAAYEEILERGARVIVLNENDKKFDTYIITLAGKYFNYNFERK